MTQPTPSATGSTDTAATLAAYATEFQLSDAPERIRSRAKLVLLDTIGVCINGADREYVHRAVETIADLRYVGSVEAGATTFATGDRRSPDVAALANATGGTALELDEGNQRSAHMGIHVVPPALAMAEREAASGQELLRAILAAYEASARVGDVIRPQKGDLHPHGTWSPVGGTIAAGLLRGLDAEELTEAIRIAVNPFVASHWAAALEGATVRNFYTGIACAHGLRAVALAASGVTGVEGAIERCLFPIVAEDPDAVEILQDAVRTMGEEYYLADSYFKTHATCRYAHAPIEALANIELGERVAEIETITVATFEAGRLLRARAPETILEAKFSTPFGLGAQLVLGGTGVDAYTEETLGDDRIREIAGRVSVQVEEQFQERAQTGVWGARVEVEMANGETLSATVEDARGGGENPFTTTEVRAKFHELVSGATASVDASVIERQVDELEFVADCTALLAPARE
jgi:2-methylcitrate dehydratase PrpD